MNISATAAPPVPEERTPRLVWAAFYWLMEALIGAVPYFVDLWVHRFMPPSGRLAACVDEKGDGVFTGCKWLPPTLDAEKCVLAIVVAGLALLASISVWHRPAGPWRRMFRTGSAVGMGATLIFASLLYAAVATAQNNDTASTVNWVWAIALVVSLFMAIEREL